MTKFFGAATNNGAVSGVKASLAEVETWAQKQLQETKATTIYAFEAVARFEVAPRTIVKTDLRPTEENTRPDVKCEPCDPKPLHEAVANGKLHFPASDDPDTHIYETY